MCLVTIFEFLKSILPTKKIAAYIVGVIAAVVALVMGISATDLKAQYCATADVVQLPKIQVAPAAPAAIAAPAVAKQEASVLTLTNGYKIPQSGDKGSTLFTALEFDIQRLNDHNHDGLNSNKLDATSISTISGNILSANWVTYGGPTGHYRQQVTLPAGLDFDTISIQIRTVAGKYLYPTIERVSDTQYLIYSIDNSLNLTAEYGIQQSAAI